MPGTPRWNAARDLLDMLGDEWIMEQVAEGTTLAQIARNCGPAMSRYMLVRWLYLEPERVSRYQEAKRAAADLLAVEAKEIVDHVPERQEAIAKARERVAVRKWLAGVKDREHAPGSQPAVPKVELHQHLHVSELHLDALRKRGGPSAIPKREQPALPAETVVEAAEVEMESVSSGVVRDA